MQNIQQQLFHDSITQFARTIVLKNSDAANSINTALLEQGYAVDSFDTTSWKYYLNLAGRYHVSDRPMTIVSLDTLEVIDFNIENLQVHLGTKREYYYGSIYYRELVAKYPKQEFLIRGILNPTPIATAIAAKEGEILYYDQSLVEPQETNLIESLQQWIYTILNTWFVPGYRVTDELYPLVQWANIYAHMAAAVRTIRWENCHTIRAHSFHIWNFLESNGKLGAYRRYVTNRQAQWLYRNIRWVNRNTGLRNTFNALLENILTTRNIPLGEYNYLPDVSSIGEPQSLSSAVDPSTPVMTTAGLTVTPRLIRTPLNMLDVVSKDPIIKTVDYVSESQIPLARDNRTFLTENIEETTEALTFSPMGTLPIKTYQSDMIDTSDQQVYNLTDFLLNHWMYLAASNRYASILTIQDPSSTEIMSMNTQEAWISFVYVWAKEQGMTLSTIPTFQAWMVRRPETLTRKELKKLFPKGAIPDRTLLALIADQLPIGTVISTEGFYTLVRGIWETIVKHYKLVAYMEHYELRAYVESVVLAFYQQAACEFTDYAGQTFEQYFADRGWTIASLSKTDLGILKEELWLKASGLDTQNLVRLKDIQAAMISLMARLGTYSVQYLATINDQSAIVIHRPSVRIGRFGETQNNHLYVKSGIQVLSLNGKLQSQHPVPIAAVAMRETQYQQAERISLSLFSPIELRESNVQHISVPMRGLNVALLNEHEMNRTLPEGLVY